MPKPSVLHSFHPLGQLEQFRKDPLLFLEKMAGKDEEKFNFVLPIEPFIYS
ncbi:hypothetical protein U9J35_22095 [Rossellomorea aquimaris]|nr:hypothetical protein [Rossellomorea aquimaris]WRP06510.1 hypothetical protein U9J35_22095 [Rossellomorea aquimaris]